jgi:hypothetical protein
MVYLLIAWWIFPWQTVSHNQMVPLKSSSSSPSYTIKIPLKLCFHRINGGLPCAKNRGLSDPASDSGQSAPTSWCWDLGPLWGQGRNPTWGKRLKIVGWIRIICGLYVHLCSLQWNFICCFCLFVGFLSASVLSNHVPFRLYLSPHPSQSLGKRNSNSLHMFQWNWAEIMAACHCYMYSKFKIYTQNHTNQFDFTDPTWRYICQVDSIDLAWPANIGTHPFAAGVGTCWAASQVLFDQPTYRILPSKFRPGTEVGRVGHFTVASGHLTLHLLPMLPSEKCWRPPSGDTAGNKPWIHKERLRWYKKHQETDLRLNSISVQRICQQLFVHHSHKPTKSIEILVPWMLALWFQMVSVNRGEYWSWLDGAWFVSKVHHQVSPVSPCPDTGQTQKPSCGKPKWSPPGNEIKGEFSVYSFTLGISRVHLVVVAYHWVLSGA